MNSKVVVMYEGERLLGGVELHPQDGAVWVEALKVIRISHYSPPSERCPPLVVLHTINSSGSYFKLEAITKKQDSPLSLLHANCLRENKTAVASIGGGEIHLVAMHSRKHEVQSACFWGFKIPSNLYNSCLVMLNQRCLGIVFDLDETLIVANTMRSFEDKIDALLRRINSESDSQRVSEMLAEVKRYEDDRNILKQYAESDQVIDNGKVIKSQSEVFPALSETHPPIIRPIIHHQDRNIILTRINPLIRDTSVLVRLRPAWEDLKSYLTASDQKGFDVFVCTMAERDYALEMWRLLDPVLNLINVKKLLDRIVCVKSGCRKSLFNVFQDGNCHPKMALVIDDRLKVWDEKDQPRVHVVPAFAPYYAPQAEVHNIVSVLCVARNVVCNVRGGFFKDYDGLLQRISKVVYEDDIKDVPSSPDVSNYLIPKEPTLASSTSSPFDLPVAQPGQAETTLHSSVNADQDFLMAARSRALQWARRNNQSPNPAANQPVPAVQPPQSSRLASNPPMKQQTPREVRGKLSQASQKRKAPASSSTSPQRVAPKERERSPTCPSLELRLPNIPELSQEEKEAMFDISQFTNPRTIHVPKDASLIKDPDSDVAWRIFQGTLNEHDIEHFSKQGPAVLLRQAAYCSVMLTNVIYALHLRSILHARDAQIWRQRHEELAASFSKERVENLEEDLAVANSRVSDLRRRNQELEEALRKSNADLMASIEEKSHLQEHVNGLNTEVVEANRRGWEAGRQVGLEEGRWEMEAKHRRSIPAIRQRAVEDFVGGRVFRLANLILGANDQQLGWDKALGQLRALGVEFDDSKLDLNLDEHLRPYPDEVEDDYPEVEGSEFEFILPRIRQIADEAMAKEAEGATQRAAAAAAARDQGDPRDLGEGSSAGAQESGLGPEV